MTIPRYYEFRGLSHKLVMKEMLKIKCSEILSLVELLVKRLEPRL